MFKYIHAQFTTIKLMSFCLYISIFLSSLSLVNASSDQVILPRWSSFQWASSQQNSNLIIPLSSLLLLQQHPHTQRSIIGNAIITAFSMGLGYTDGINFYPWIRVITTTSSSTHSTVPTPARPIRVAQHVSQQRLTSIQTREDVIRSHYQSIITQDTAISMATGEEFGLFFMGEDRINNPITFTPLARDSRARRTMTGHPYQYNFNSRAFSAWLIEHRTRIDMQNSL